MSAELCSALLDKIRIHWTKPKMVTVKDQRRYKTNFEKKPRQVYIYDNDDLVYMRQDSSQKER